jgi:hypothetical protein
MTTTIIKDFKLNKFTTKNGEYSTFIESMKNSKMKFSGLRILDKAVFEKMTREEFGKWSQKQPENFDGLKEEYALIEEEIRKHCEIASSLYTYKMDEKVHGMSLCDLINQFEASLLPLRKLSQILQPQVTISKTVHPRTNITYAVVKGYWIDAAGNLKRSVNRNIGVEEWKLAELATKMFSPLGFTYFEPAVKMGNGIMVDMVISKGDKSWVVEIKEIDRDAFIKTFISLELWRMYKKEYGIKD